VGHFIFAADVGKALNFSGTGGGEKDGSAARELRFHVAHAGDDVAMKARTGARGEFELVRGPNAERELLDMDLRSFFQGPGEFFLRREIVTRGGRVCVPVPLVILCRRRQILRGRFTERLRLVQKNNRPERTLFQIEECAWPRLASRSKIGRATCRERRGATRSPGGTRQ